MLAGQKFQDSMPAALSTLTVIPGRDHGVQLLPLSGVTDDVVAFLDARASA